MARRKARKQSRQQRAARRGVFEHERLEARSMLATLTLTAQQPGTGPVSVASDIVLDFSENIVAGTGSIVINGGTGDVRSFSVTDASQVTIRGNRLTLNPTADLNPSKSYSVQVDAGAVRTLAGDAYAGISNTTSFAFSTGNVIYTKPLSANGNTGGTGTLASPYQSLGYASTRAAAGTTIYVIDPASPVTRSYTLAAVGTAAAPVVMKPAPGNGLYRFANLNNFKIDGASNFVIEGFTIDGGTSGVNVYDIASNPTAGVWTQTTATTYGAIGINVTTGTNIVIRDNVFQHLQQKAVNIESGRYVDVIGNVIYDVATTSLSGGHGIMRQQGTGVFGTADESGNYRWDISGNLIFNVQQRLYSWVPSKGYMNFSFDEGKPINIDETTDTQMMARIADNVIAFPAIDAIRLKPTANLDVSNNSIYATAAIADGITDANTLVGVSTPFPGMTLRNNLIQTAAGRYGLEVNDAFPTTTDTGRVSGNVLSGGLANPSGLPGVTTVSTGLFTSPGTGNFTPASGVSTTAGANPTVLANLTRKATTAGITVASDGWVNDNIKLTQTLLDAIPGLEDGVSGNETVFTAPGQYTASVREAGRKSMLFPVNSTWQTANVATADLAVAGGKYEIITSADYSAWRDATQAAYTGYGSVRWGDSVIGQNKVFDSAGLTVMAVRGASDFTKTVATGKTITIDGDLLVDLSTYTTSGTQTFDIVKAGTVTSANGAGATFDTIRIKQPSGGTYTAQVSLVDTDSNSVADTVRLTIQGSVVVNAAPTDIALSAATVAENAATGTTVGTLSTTDADSADTFTYTLVSGTGSADNALFTVAGNTIKTASSFDFETKSSYSVRIRSTDAAGAFTEKAFTITVANVNEVPADVALSATAVAENAAVGTTVGTLTSTDPDAGDTFTYSLVSGTGSTDNASFTITGSSLKTATTFNWATKSSYGIRIRATDAGGLTTEKAFTITVTEANVAPTNISLSAATVVENSTVGTTVGTLTTTDSNASDTFTYTLVSGTGSTDNTSFTIAGNAIKTAASVDFETKSSYSVRIRSTDAGGLFTEKAFTITVTNVNEAPTDIALSAATVAENAVVGTTVGTLSATDADAGDTATYSLVAGTGSTDNASFTIVGSAIKTAAVFDFEGKSSYSIRVRATDAGGLVLEKVFLISVTNANEAPTDINLSSTLVSESATVGSTVATLSTSDPDAGDTFTYTLVSGIGSADNAAFTIAGNTLKAATAFNLAVKGSYSIRIRAIDAGGLTTEKAFTLTVTNNVPAAPINLLLSATSIREILPAGSVVGTFTSVDPNATDTFTYALVAGSGDIDNASFSVAGDELRTSARFDYETKNSYSIRVQTTDSTQRTFTKSFTISVTDANELQVAVATGAATAVQEKTFFHEGVGTLTFPSISTPWWIQNTRFVVADASKNPALVLDTAKGAFIGLGNYGANGRVATIGTSDMLNMQLRSDPGQGGLTRGIYNLYSWLSGTPRTVGQPSVLHVLRASDSGVADGTTGIHRNHGMFVEFFNTSTSYVPAENNNGYSGALVSGNTSAFTSAGRLQQALIPDGAWSRDYAVVELPSSASADEVALVRWWMIETGGGVLVSFDGTPSAAIASLLADVGLASKQEEAFPGGDHTPTSVDPKNVDVVFKALTGLDPGVVGQTAAQPIWLRSGAVADVMLPTEIPGATVSWTTSDAAVMTATGHVGTTGMVTLTATARYADGTSLATSVYYRVFSVTANTGLNFRVIDTRSYLVNGSRPSASDIGAFMSGTLLSQTPIASSTSATVGWNSDSPYPGGIQDSLFTYSGYLVPSASGSHVLKLSADDGGRLYIEGPNGLVSQSAGWWSSSEQTLTLEAGKPYRMWLFFKPGGPYDSVKLEWKTPGSSSFVTVPAANFGSLPDGMLSAAAGYPSAFLPFASGAQGGPLSTTAIMSADAVRSMAGNFAPVAASQELNLREADYNFPATNFAFTDAVAAQATSLSIRLVNANGTDSIRLVNRPLTGVTNGATLAAAMQSMLAAANTASGSSGTITVAYADNTLRVTDTAGRTIKDFVIARNNDIVVTTYGAVTFGTDRREAAGATPAVPSTAFVSFDITKAGTVKYVSLALDSTDNTKDVSIVVPIDMTGKTLAEAVQAAIRTRMGNTNVSVAWNTGTSRFTVTDATGRAITSFLLHTDLPAGSNQYRVGGQAYSQGAESATPANVRPTTLRVVISTPEIVRGMTRVDFAIRSTSAALSFEFNDLPIRGLGLSGAEQIAGCIQDALQAAMGDTSITADFNTLEPNTLIITDALGRDISRAVFKDTADKIPLVMPGQITGGGAMPTVATVGVIGGRIYASDTNNDALTFSLVAPPAFGSVTLDAATGAFTYKPFATGVFRGWDEFTVRASDGRGGTSSTFALRITDLKAADETRPVVNTVTIPDPVYTEPAPKTGVSLPSDFTFRDVFIAQTHVQRPSDPYLELTQNRYALLKFNATSASNARAPDFVVTVTDKNGAVVGSLRLTGPDRLPTSVNLPSMATLGLGTHSDADSYIAPLPGTWIKPGITIKVTAAGSTTPITSFAPKVGPDVPLTMYFFNFSKHDLNDASVTAGIADWATQALVNLPASSLRLYMYPYINLDRFTRSGPGALNTYTGNITSLPGADPRAGGGGFIGDIGWAIGRAGMLRSANDGAGWYGSMAYVSIHQEPGGGLGGGSNGGGGPSNGIFWHELAGHGMGRGHAADDSAYPYNKIPYNGGADTSAGWLGPNWGYNQLTGAYQNVSFVDANGKTQLYGDPQAGGWQDHPGNNFGMFSDYYSYLNLQYLKGMTVWMPDASNTVDGGFAGTGYLKQWDTSTNQWVVATAANYSQFKGYWGPNVVDIPIQHDVPVYWLTYDAYTKAGGGISPGADYAPGLEVFPVRTTGNLLTPFRDIVTGSGRDADSNTLNGDYVMRVTYATENGLITDNLIVPANYGAGTSLNVPDKGELVRVDVVEAENASVAAFYRNKIVASYVNSESLANTVFGGDGNFTVGSSQLTLPAYWHGSKVLWSSTTAGLVDLATGRVDGTKLTDGSAIRAQWTENGVLQTRTFALALPSTIQATATLFGKPSSETTLPGYQVVGGNLVIATNFAGGSVAWSSSDPAVISPSGAVLSTGSAVLTARVTYGNGAVRTYAASYFAQTTDELQRSNPYVTNQLFGRPYTENAVTVATFVNTDLTLPATVEHGTVSWKSSAPAVITDAGRVVGTGAATLSAIVTFDSGETRVFSRAYYAVTEKSLKTSNAYVTNQLFGFPSDQAAIAGTRIAYANLTLPTTIERGTVSWATSNAAAVTAAGIVGTGTAMLTATVTFDDATTRQYSITYYAESSLAFAMSTPYVTNQLFGRSYTETVVTAATFVNADLTLPATIDRGTVSWTSSATNVITNAGRVVAAGTATLTATVRFDGGETRVYSRNYFVVTERSLKQSNAYVTNQLFGTPSDQAVVAGTRMVYANLTLPTTIEGGTVSWATSNAAAVTAAGAVGSGAATLTATVTFDDSTVRQYSTSFFATTSLSFATSTPYVMNQLFGAAMAEAVITSPKLLNSNLTLPATVDRGTVIWTSSNTSVMTNAGVMVGSGSVTMSARVTFDNGTQTTYSRAFYVVSSATGLTTGGLLFRVVDATGYTYNGSTPGTAEMDKFIVPELTNKSPIATATNQYPNWANSGGYPVGTANGNAAIQALWSYTGFITPTVTGSYQINVKGDDGYKLFVMKDGVVSSVMGRWDDANGKTLTIDLAAGKAYPIWLYYHPSADTGTNYVTLTWKSPNDASFVSIPTSQLASTPSTLVSPTAGVASGLLPIAEASATTFNTGGVGLQLRVVDLTAFTLTNTASGMDHYINSEVLNRTPLYTGTALPNWSRTAGSNHLQTTVVPSVLRNASNYVKESLWAFSGTFLPQVTGSYQFKITADDDGRLFIGSAGATQQANSGGTITISLTAGVPVPMWVFYKTANTTSADPYWPDNISVQMIAPGGSAFADIPPVRLAPMPDSLVPPTSGYPAALLPKSNSSASPFDTGLGLQLRVVDLTNMQYTNTASGMDHYLSPEVLATTPIYSGTALPNWTKNAGAYKNVVVPDVFRNSSGYVKQSLWAYSGYYLPKVTGTYVFQFAADEEGRLYIDANGTMKSVSADYWSVQTLTVDLVAGRPTPIWAFFRTGTPDDYWADSIQLTVKTPGDSAFAAIPFTQLAPLPDTLVPPNAGYPASQLPTVPAASSDAFNTGGAGLQLRVVDLTTFSLANTASGMDHYITPEVLDRTPLYSGTAVPNWSRSDGSNHLQTTVVPSVLRNSSNYVKESLWAFSGFYLPQATGSHQFKITADDDGRLFVGAPGVTQQANSGGTITVNLTAGVPVPMWVFFKTANTTTADPYWGDKISVQMMPPGSSTFADIPAVRLAPMPDSLVPPTGGYPAAFLPRASAGNSFDTGLGLQLRVVDLTNFQFTNTASGMDHYISPEVLATTPIYSGTALPNWTKNVGAYGNVIVPDVLRNASGYVKESLWTYSGYFLPKVSGTHVFQLAADNDGRLYVEANGTTQLVGTSGTLSVDLVAGRPTPIWVFFKTGTPDDYWADLVQLTVKSPGETSFSVIPSTQFAPLPDSLVPPAAGYPAAQLPGSANRTTGQFDTGLGLTLRVVDLTSATLPAGVSGFDRYLSPEILGQTPIYSGTALPNWTKMAGQYSNVIVPDALRNPWREVKESLWAYSGFIVPEVTGTYVFEFSADDEGRLYIGPNGAAKSVSTDFWSSKTLSIDLVAGQPTPIWVFFRTGTAGDYWADLVRVRWQAPGTSAFTDIPKERLITMPESLLPPLAGYPAVLLPFTSTASRTVPPTVVPADTAFSPVVAQSATVLPIAATVTSNLDRRVVAGSTFEQQLPVAAGLDAPGLSHWVKFRLRSADGSIIERDPGEPWTVSVSGTTMTVRGRIDSLPNFRVESIVVYSDDNTVDAVPATTATIHVNPLPGSLVFAPASFPTGQRSGATVGTLSVTGASPSDTFTYSIVQTPSPGIDASLFAIVGNTLQTRYAFDSSVDTTARVRIKATNAFGFSTESDIVVGKAPRILVQPASMTAAAGTTVSFGVVATGGDTFQWQSSSDNGNSWRDMSAATRATLSVAAANGTNRFAYRVVISNASGSTTSSPATLTVQSLMVSSLTDASAPGTTTLREAFTYANTITDGSPSITFDPAIFSTSRTVTLASSLPTLSNKAGRVSIAGPGAGLLTLQGGSTGSNFRAFGVDVSANSGMTATITGLTFRGFNSTTAGGAISNSATLTLDGVEFIDNVSSGNGGAVYNAGTLTVTGSTFATNVAGLGGGIFNAAGKTLTGVNSTFTGNRSAGGGAIRNEGTATLRSLTISGNTATSGSGGGISVAGTTTTNVYDVIVAGNTNTAGRSDVSGTVNNGSGNLVGDGTGLTGLLNGSNSNQVGTSAVAIDPKLGSLASNGGPVRTMALLAGSPAINAGDTGAAATDQRGYPRPQGAKNDIGAFETLESVLPTITQQPSAITRDAGYGASFTAAASGTPAPTVMWQTSLDGVTWTAVPGATSTTLTLSSTSRNDHGRLFRAAFTNSSGTATTLPASLAVRYLPVLATQPESSTVAPGAAATFRVAGAGSPAATVQWQKSTNGGRLWSDIFGATSLTFTAPSASQGDDGTLYRAVLTNSLGATPSAAAMLTVKAAETVVVGGGETTTDTGSRTGDVELVKDGDGTLVLDKPNAHSGGTVVEKGDVVVRDTAALGTGGLTVKTGSSVVLDVHADTVTLPAITVQGGTIDLGYGRLTIQQGGFDQQGIRDLIAAGRNGGDWAGSEGIISREAASTGRTVGYVTNDDGSMTVAFAAGGDTNLDSVIDVIDIANFLSSNAFDAWIDSSWSQGDFNYDGIVDILDALEYLTSGLLDVGSYIPSLASAQSTDTVSLNAAAPETTLVEAAPASTATESTLSAVEFAFAALATDAGSTGRPAKKLAFAKLA